MKGFTATVIVVFFLGFVSGEKTESSRTELGENAQRERFEKYKAGISENTSKISTIKSSFRQIKHLSFLSDKVITSGKFFLKKNGGRNLVKWQYTEPFDYQIVLDGRNVFMKDGNKVRSFDMSSNSVFEELNDIMIKSLDGTILTENENFNFKIYENDGRLYVDMEPSKSTMKEYFKRIKIVFDKKDYTVKKLKMIERDGDSTEIFFNDRRINIPLDDSEFQLK